MALDDFEPGDAREPLVPFADFIKVDIGETAPEEVAILIGRHGRKSSQLLALSVDSRQDFATAKDQGFTQFQGYFFRQTGTCVLATFPRTKSPTCGCCRLFPVRN